MGNTGSNRVTMAVYVCVFVFPVAMSPCNWAITGYMLDTENMIH